MSLLFQRYANAQFELEVQYTLTGASAGTRSDVTEVIRVHSLVGPLDFHFFQYADFGLNAGLGNDTVMFMNANAVRQWDGTTAPFGLTETAITPSLSGRERDFYSNTLAKLTDLDADNLRVDPFGSPLTGDVTWAFQWDANLGQGDLIISKDKNLGQVPEPATMALMGGALLLFSHIALRRRKKS